MHTEAHEICTNVLMNNALIYNQFIIKVLCSWLHEFKKEGGYVTRVLVALAGSSNSHVGEHEMLLEATGWAATNGRDNRRRTGTHR